MDAPDRSKSNSIGNAVIHASPSMKLVVAVVVICVSNIFRSTGTLWTLFTGDYGTSTMFVEPERTKTAQRPVTEMTMEECFPENATLPASMQYYFTNLQHLTRDGRPKSAFNASSLINVPSPPSREKPYSVFFLHIQKAGGTAVDWNMANRFCKCPEKHIFSVGECRKQCFHQTLDNGNKVYNYNSRLSTGWRCGVHANMNKIDNCTLFQNTTQDEVAVITWMREPVDRLLSEFHHCQDTAKEGKKCWEWKPPVPHDDWNLTVFLGLNNSMPYHNRQMKMLSGCNRKETDWMDPVACQKCFEQAKKNLRERFVFIGLQEANAFFLKVLGTSLMGGTPLLLLTEDSHKNTRAQLLNQEKKLRASDLDSVTLQSIHESNRYDVELYRYAKDFLCAKYQTLLHM